MSDYAVVFERAGDGGWSAYAPDVPGVVAAAGTREAVELRMREALKLYGEELARHGEAPPAATSEVAVITT